MSKSILTHRVLGLVLVLAILTSVSALATQTINSDDHQTDTAAAFDQSYAQLHKDANATLASLPTSLQKVALSNEKGIHPKASAAQAKILQQYKIYRKQLKEVDRLYNFKESLKATYRRSNQPVSDSIELNEESYRLAKELLGEIPRLKKKYHLFPMPLVHNMLISVSLKKRGACKHWAEDLLTFLTPKPRKFFSIAWGEANSGKMDEHNVCVLFAKGGKFDQGLIVDPWRTAGKPYWVEVLKDHKYHWNMWEDFGIH